MKAENTNDNKDKNKDKRPNFLNFFRTPKSNNSDLSNGKQRT